MGGRETPTAMQGGVSHKKYMQAAAATTELKQHLT
jgi:hypothetical protein